MKRSISYLTLISVIGMPLAAVAQDKPKSITVAAYGGVWAESIRKNIVPCFEARTGVKVEIASGESADWLARINANPQHPPIHVVALSEADSFRANEAGLLDQISVERVPNLVDIPEAFYTPWDSYSVAIHYSGLGVLYDKTKMDAPKDWREFIEKSAAGEYADGVSMPAGTYTWGPEWIWSIAQAYDGSIDEAFAKFKAASDSVPKFWTTPTEAQNLFGTQAVQAVVMWDGRANNFIAENDWAAFAIPEPGGLAGSALLSKVKNAPDVAFDYIDCALSAEVQKGHAETLMYGVVNKNVIYPTEIADKITPIERVIVPPYGDIIGNFPAWIERWNKEMR